jgi:hypothetical protein
MAVGPLLAIVVALSQSWAAFPALGFAEARDVFIGHLLTKGLDYGPSFFLALLIWVACDRAGLRDAKFAVVVGVVASYAAPRLYALIYLLFGPYRMPIDLGILLAPRIDELVIGAVLAIVMWAIAYWRPPSAARIAAGS